MSDPKVSVIVCTRNRSAELRRALPFWNEITAPLPWELILVDNGSADETQSIIREFASSARVIFRPLVEPRPGLSRARNLGWAAASAQVISFTDDDCYPQSDYVCEIWNNFADGRLGYLGGRVLLYDPEDYPITIQTRAERIDIPPRRFIPAGLIHGANMAARKAVFEAIGGFDELLGAGTPFTGEDVDFLSRASAAGFAGAYDPRPVVSHHHRRRSPESIRRLGLSYDLGRGAYYMKGLLDPTRRRSIARGWWSSLEERFYGPLTPRQRRAIRLNEFKGGVYYLWRRFFKRPWGHGSRARGSPRPEPWREA